jgi:membrane-associated protease RseP (regulator of RpoE activity)
MERRIPIRSPHGAHPHHAVHPERLGPLVAALVVATLIVVALIAYRPGLAPLIIGLALGALLIALRRLTVRPGESALPGSVAATSLRMVPPEQVPTSVDAVMAVRLATTRAHAALFRGPLRTTPEEAYAHVAAEFPRHTVVLAEDPEVGARLAIVPSLPRRAAAYRPILAIALLAITFVTTTLAGAVYVGINLETEPFRLAAGLPYSLGLLAILGVHELGHYIAARRHGMNVSLPYFIPAPVALGTFGAFIQLRSPAENRRTLFDMAIAGPLAGLAVALPILWLGLSDSAVGTTATVAPDFGRPTANSSLLLGLIARAALSTPITADTILILSPLAFAGWLGLFVTALNLIPVGELDGGHIVHAMFGARLGEIIGSGALVALFAIALFAVPGLLLWAILVFAIAGRTIPPKNDLTPLTPGRRALGWFAVTVFLAIVIPYPA